MEKRPGDIILHMCAKNYDQMMYSSSDMVHNRQTDRQTDKLTDKQKKWHREVGALPKKRQSIREREKKSSSNET